MARISASVKTQEFLTASVLDVSKAEFATNYTEHGRFASRPRTDNDLTCNREVIDRIKSGTKSTLGTKVEEKLPLSRNFKISTAGRTQAQNCLSTFRAHKARVARAPSWARRRAQNRLARARGYCRPTPTSCPS
jgi:hypothetical protein